MIRATFCDARNAVLAVSQRDGAPVVTANEGCDCERSSSKLRIFIVDDLEKFRTSFRFVLTAYGHDVKEAPHPEDAFDRLISKDEEFDLIFIDVQMEGKDGISLYQDLRSAGVEIPIVLMSALPQNRLRVEALGVPFFDKALDEGSLQDILERYGGGQAQ